MTTLNKLILCNEVHHKLQIHCADFEVTMLISQLINQYLGKENIIVMDFTLPYIVVSKPSFRFNHELFEFFDNVEIIKNQDSKFALIYFNNTLIIKNLYSQYSINITMDEEPTFDIVDCTLSMYLDMMEDSSDPKVQKMYNFIYRVYDTLWCDKANEVLAN